MFFKYLILQELVVFEKWLNVQDCTIEKKNNRRRNFLGKGMEIKLGCSTSGLVLDCWLLSHVIYLKLRKKKLFAKLSKFAMWSWVVIL